MAGEKSSANNLITANTQINIIALIWLTIPQLWDLFDRQIISKAECTEQEYNRKKKDFISVLVTVGTLFL